MLMAIHKIDLGTYVRLGNIEETEKAKQVAKDRKDCKIVTNDEEHLVAMHFYCPHIKRKSDVEIMGNAKLEVMGLAPQEEQKPRHDKPQMATDELVMERQAAPK